MKTIYEAFKADVTWTSADNLDWAKGWKLACIYNADAFSRVCAKADSKGLKDSWVGPWRTMEETRDEAGWSGRFA